MRQLRAWAAAVAALAISVGCSDTAPTSPEGTPQFNHIPGDPAEVGHFVLCKEGTAAEFTADVNGSVTTVALADGECQDIFTSPVGGGSADITVTETANPGLYLLDHIDVATFGLSGPTGTSTITGTNSYTTYVNGDLGEIVTFHNTPVLNGRMTGGGGQIIIGDVRVTRGFTVHCDITLSNNLEINWPDHRWHLDKPLTSATCIDDPAVEPAPPPAPFDTFIGEGVGSLDGVPGSTVKFVFVDSGEPGGKADLAEIKVWSPGGSLVLDVPLQLLDHGNAQAHYDQPHK